jgi:hypothetical protein
MTVANGKMPLLLMQNAVPLLVHSDIIPKRHFTTCVSLINLESCVLQDKIRACVFFLPLVPTSHYSIENRSGGINAQS